jgi:multidrug resistance efflux pump
MSEKEQQPSTDEAKANEAQTGEAQKDDNSAATSVKKGTVAILLVITATLVWYLLSDRFTPYTSQARIQGYVVGVAPKVAGVVTKVWVSNNQEVTVDQPLFEIDRSQYEIALKKAQSDLESTRRQVGAGTAGVASAQANLLAAQANKTRAQQDAERQERLYKEDSGAISVRRVEMARASLEQALAQVTAAEAEIERAKEQRGGEVEDNAQLKSAQSTVDNAERDLGNTVVKASARGIITDLRTDVGQFAAAGASLMTLISINDIWINAEFTENNLGHVRIGTAVEIVVDALPGTIIGGKIRSIGLGVSAGLPSPAGTLPSIENSRDWLRQSQRYPVIIEFDPGQRDQLKEYVRIGGQAEVIAYTEEDGVLWMIGKAYIRMMSWLSYAY